MPQLLTPNPYSRCEPGSLLASVSVMRSEDNDLSVSMVIANDLHRGSYDSYKRFCTCVQPTATL